MKKIYFTWEDFDTAINEIAFRVKSIGYRPTSIYGIPRGGLIVAVALSHKLDIPITNGIGFRSKRLLVCDEICETGKTLSLYGEGCATAVIHFKQNSLFIPDIGLYEKPDNSWIVYPWENKETEGNR